jgi:membrane associated rhomboid family serine protease
VRLPVVTVCIAVLAIAQHLFEWTWGLNGWTRGLDRVVHAVTAVFAHADGGHLQTNSIGIISAVAAVEMLLGRRWLVAVFAVAVADMYFFTGEYIHIRGASGLVMAATGTLLALVPDALAKARDARGDWRSRLQISAGTFCVIYTPIAAWSDLTGLRTDDDVAQGAHLRCLAAGLTLGVFALVLRARRLVPARA